jgi:thiosulfate/3-mercaptopyruvate sulfurtransferase
MGHLSTFDKRTRTVCPMHSRHLLRRSAALSCLLLTAASLRAADSRDSLMVSSAWLAAHLKDPNLVVLASGPKPTYDAGHIPGARFVTMTDFTAPMDHSKMKPTDLMTEMPDAGAFRDTLQKFGISDTSRIVIYYSDKSFSPTTRIIYALNWAGLGANTVMLDGGLRAWKNAGNATTTDTPSVTPGRLSPLKVRPDLIVDANFVQTTAKTPGYALVDGRATSAYEGMPLPSGNGGSTPLGHIPGAKSVSFEDAFNEREELRSPQELEQLFTKAGVKPGDTIVGYCWVGQQATAMLFAARTLGHDVKLYDGSINDWTARDLPLEIVKKGGAR